jgi:hypothetical protein
MLKARIAELLRQQLERIHMPRPEHGEVPAVERRQFRLT